MSEKSALERILEIEKRHEPIATCQTKDCVHWAHKIPESDELFLLRAFQVMRDIASLCIAESDGYVKWNNNTTIDEEFNGRMADATDSPANVSPRDSGPSGRS